MELPNLLINSHINNSNALQLLLDSINLLEGVFNIYIVIGGCYDLPSYDIAQRENQTLIKANHNSIDFTAFISILECSDILHIKENESFLYLHDTCKVGLEFINKLKKYTPFNTIGIGHPSMNIGIYEMKTLKQFERNIMELKNNDPLKELFFKNQGFNVEGLILHLSRCPLIINNKAPYEVKGYEDVYNTGFKRRIDYIECLDLYKFKANYPKCERNDKNKLSL